MTRPLALLLFERLMPGSQLVNRLQDMQYRVMVVSDPEGLPDLILREQPLFLMVDMESRTNLFEAIQRLKAESPTRHLPIIAFGPDRKTELFEAAQKAGANLTIGEARLAAHLPQLLSQALEVD